MAGGRGRRTSSQMICPRVDDAQVLYLEAAACEEASREKRSGAARAPHPCRASCAHARAITPTLVGVLGDTKMTEMSPSRAGGSSCDRRGQRRQRLARSRARRNAAPCLSRLPRALRHTRCTSARHAAHALPPLALLLRVQRSVLLLLTAHATARLHRHTAALSVSVPVPVRANAAAVGTPRYCGQRGARPTDDAHDGAASHKSARRSGVHTSCPPDSLARRGGRRAARSARWLAASV